jgi:hypothetical protein
MACVIISSTSMVGARKILSFSLYAQAFSYRVSSLSTEPFVGEYNATERGGWGCIVPTSPVKDSKKAEWRAWNRSSGSDINGLLQIKLILPTRPSFWHSASVGLYTYVLYPTLVMLLWQCVDQSQDGPAGCAGQSQLVYLRL